MADVKVLNELTDTRVVDCLKSGGIIVARTDTLYGVLARADDERAVSRVYALKNRDDNKSPIVLIADRKQLHDAVPDTIARVMDKKWPGTTSIIVPTRTAPKWLRRGNDSVAYRLPGHEDLCQLIRQTGPLIAPSANPEALVPALNIEQAYDYFGPRVDIYVDGGRVDDTAPSRLLRIGEDGSVERLR